MRDVFVLAKKINNVSIHCMKYNSLAFTFLTISSEPYVAHLGVGLLSSADRYCSVSVLQYGYMYFT